VYFGRVHFLDGFVGIEMINKNLPIGKKQSSTHYASTKIPFLNATLTIKKVKVTLLEEEQM
jgi:hypothetical protein